MEVPMLDQVKGTVRLFPCDMSKVGAEIMLVFQSEPEPHFVLMGPAGDRWCSWPMTVVKKYKVENASTEFSFSVGRRAETGPGDFAFLVSSSARVRQAMVRLHQVAAQKRGAGLKHGYQNMPNSGTGASPERPAAGSAAAPTVLTHTAARSVSREAPSGTVVYETVSRHTYGNVMAAPVVTAAQATYSTVNKGGNHDYYNLDPKNMPPEFQPPEHRAAAAARPTGGMQVASTGYVNVVPAGYETVELPGFNLRGSSPDLDPLSAYETVEPDEVVDHFLREQHG